MFLVFLFSFFFDKKTYIAATLLVSAWIVEFAALGTVLSIYYTTRTVIAQRALDLLLAHRRYCSTVGERQSRSTVH